MSKENDRNVYIGPDYNIIAKQQTNGAIIEAFVPYLFSKRKIIDGTTLLVVFRNIILLLLIKTALEESKDYLNSFKFTDLNFIKYYIQKIQHSEVKFDILLIDNKWIYLNKILSLNSLTLFFEKKMIYLSNSKTYHYRQGKYIVKIITSDKNIVICVPNDSNIITYVKNEIIDSNIDYICGNTTKMYRVIAHTIGIHKLECIKESHAFSTENYKKLYKSLKNYFLVNSCINSQNIICYNFDGEPGTGKTTFGYYIARKDLFTRVIICNLIQLTKKDFKETIKNVESLIISKSSYNTINIDENERILLIIDEMDKWLESYLQEITQYNREELQNKKILVDKENSTCNVMAQKLTKQEEIDKKNQLKETFFDQLFALLDGLLLSSNINYVLVFNTNNFDAMFDNCDKRYLALKDRFKKFTFNKNSKNDVIIYLDKFLKYLLKSKNIDPKDDLYFYLHNFDRKMYDLIPDNIQISYRRLMTIMQECSYNIECVINQLSYLEKIENNIL